MTRSIAIAVVTLTFVLVGAAQAQDKKPSFSEADANGDGKVSLKEAKKHGFSKYQFIAQDVNQDGMLTEQDWKYLSTRSNFRLYDRQG